MAVLGTAVQEKGSAFLVISVVGLISMCGGRGKVNDMKKETRKSTHQ